MALNSDHETSSDGRELVVRGWAETNVLWRTFGIHAIPHVPCMVDCAESAAFGRNLLDLGRTSGVREEVDTIEQILTWPAEWIADGGEVEIKSPFVTIVTSLPPSLSERRQMVVRRVGRSLGWETHRDGTLHNDVRLTTQVHSAGNPIRRRAAANGFFSLQGMKDAHRPIVDYICRIVDQQRGVTVLDLGCGDGALLEAICDQRGNVKPQGVEVDSEAASQANCNLRRRGGSAIAGDMFDCRELWDDTLQYDVVLLMICRSFEVSDDRAKALLRQVQARARHLIVYAYDDELIRYDGSLGDLASRCGLQLSGWNGGLVCEARGAV